MKVLGKQVFRFEEIELDPAQGCIKSGERETYLRQKLMHLLVYLVERRDRVVTKGELIENVWRGAAITDDALVQSIKELRRCLGDDPRQPRFIKTIPKTGYRFIAPVEEVIPDDITALRIEEITTVEVEYEKEINNETLRRDDAEARGKGSRRRILASLRPRVIVLVAVAMLVAASGLVIFLRPVKQQSREVALTQVPGKKVLAVMHFENRSGDRDLDWLREGLADMLITNLSRSRNLSVLGRGQLHLLLERTGHDFGSSIRLDEALNVASQVQAEAVAVGSFARLDGQIRVDVQLYDARGQLLTAERLVLEQPSQLLTQIDLLSLKLGSYLSGPADEETDARLASVMTNNLRAYHYYSLGVEKANTLLYAEAVRLLEEAARLDPEFAMAYARIGYTYAMCWQRAEEAKPYLEKAFQLSDRLTDKDRLSIAAWYAVANLDFSTAIETYRKIIAHYPLEVEAYWRLARLLRGEDRMEESVEIARQGLAVDSGAKDLYNVLGVTYMEMGRHDDAIATLRRYIELAPQDPNIYDSLGMAYQWAGRYEEAIATYEKALALNPRFEIAVIHLANTYFWQGRYREAMRQYHRFIQLASFDNNRSRGYDSITVLHLKRNEPAEAERAARAAFSHDEKYVGALLKFALQRGDLVTAEKHLAFLEANPGPDRGNRAYERPSIYYHGYLALKSGRADEAVEHFRVAIRHRPTPWNIDAYEDCLAKAYLELGRLDEAIAEYERVLRLNPNYPLAQFYLAQCYELKGEREMARAAYERFLEVWKSADEDVPEVIAAKRKLASLL